MHMKGALLQLQKSPRSWIPDIPCAQPANDVSTRKAMLRSTIKANEACGVTEKVVYIMNSTVKCLHLLPMDLECLFG
jgi:hypothetical protein